MGYAPRALRLRIFSVQLVYELNAWVLSPAVQGPLLVYNSLTPIGPLRDSQMGPESIKK
jgi:hypothetical protein